MSAFEASPRRQSGQSEFIPQLRVIEFDSPIEPLQSVPDLTSVDDSNSLLRDHSVQMSRLRTQFGSFLKRAFDLTMAIPVVLFVVPPLCVLVKICQMLQSNGPLFYRQTRSGRDGVEFRIFKFRTMNVPPPGETDLEENPASRIYPIGEFLRRSKIDEIPQFINVLQGSMSVVGPRPHHFEDCVRFGQRVQEYPLRSIAKPGITGLAQYKEYRGDFAWNCVASRVAKDLNYIRRWSITLDVILVAKTINIVIWRTLYAPTRRTPATHIVQPGVSLAVYHAASPTSSVGDFDGDTFEKRAA